jgi:hypothetical protein
MRRGFAGLPGREESFGFLFPVDVSLRDTADIDLFVRL